MNAQSKLFFIILILLLFFKAIAPAQAYLNIPEEALLAVNNQLDINTQEQCESLGGTWNDCPMMLIPCEECSEDCGKPICEGIVPEEAEDLSSVHNPLITQPEKASTEDIKLETRKQEMSNQIKPPSDIIKLTKPPIDKSSYSIISEHKMMVYAILGLILIFIFIWIKYKPDKKTKHKKRD